MIPPIIYYLLAGGYILVQQNYLHMRYLGRCVIYPLDITLVDAPGHCVLCLEEESSHA